MTMFSEKIINIITGFKDKIVTFSVMRNERLRVEPWIAHYRNIGIQQFFVIDNGSDDGTYEFLSSQPDVVVERTQDSYQKSNFGINWLNRFRQIIGPDKWVLFADADELLVYEGWPHLPVIEIIRKAEAEGSNAVLGFLLDMYPDGPLDSCPSKIDDNLFLVAPCFDSDYTFKFLPGNTGVSIIGGPRVRFLSTMEREKTVSRLDLFIRAQTIRIANWSPAVLVPTIVRYLPRWMPEIFKTPLAKDSGCDLIRCTR